MFYVRRTLGEVVRICEKKTLWAELSTTAMNIVSMVIACQTSSQCVHLFVRWWEDISWKEKKSNAYVVCLLIDHTHTSHSPERIQSNIVCAIKSEWNQSSRRNHHQCRPKIRTIWNQCDEIVHNINRIWLGIIVRFDWTNSNLLEILCVMRMSNVDCEK